MSLTKSILIPVNGDNTELKKDLVYEKLSNNKNIDYIKEISRKEISNLISEVIDSKDFSNNKLPILLEVFFKDLKNINLEYIKEEATSIDGDILILERNMEGYYTKNEFLTIMIFFYALGLFVIFLFFKISLNNNKKMIILLREFGASDRQVVNSYTFGYLFLMLGGLAVSFMPSLYFSKLVFLDVQVSFHSMSLIYFIINILIFFIVLVMLKILIKNVLRVTL